MDRSRIGIDRALHPEWLDAAAGLAVRGVSADEARRALLDVLGRELSSSGSRSAADKTASVLLRTWFKVGPDASALRADAVARIESSDAPNRLAIHWALLLASYPFFIDCASSAGRLLSLSDSFRRVEYSRRVAELWGERPTANRASGRVLETLVAMGALSMGDSTYQRCSSLAVHGASAAMLMEGLMTGQGRSGAPADQLGSHPAFFCFDLPPLAVAIATPGRLSLESRGGDTDTVVLNR